MLIFNIANDEVTLSKGIFRPILGFKIWLAFEHIPDKGWMIFKIFEDLNDLTKNSLARDYLLNAKSLILIFLKKAFAEFSDIFWYILA